MRIVHLEEILRNDRRRRVDQDVDAAEFGDGVFGHGADSGIVIDVGGNADDTAGISLFEFSHRGRVVVGALADEHGDGALGEQFLGAGLADSAAPPSDDSDFIFGPEIHRASPCKTGVSPLPSNCVSVE